MASQAAESKQSGLSSDASRGRPSGTAAHEKESPTVNPLKRRRQDSEPGSEPRPTRSSDAASTSPTNLRDSFIREPVADSWRRSVARSPRPTSRRLNSDTWIPAASSGSSPVLSLSRPLSSLQRARSTDDHDHPRKLRKTAPALRVQHIAGSGKTDFNGIQGVPTGPRQDRHSSFPVDADLTVKRSPHIFVSSNCLPPSHRLVKHLYDLVKKYIRSDVDLLVTSSGYYMLFESTNEGRRRLTLCHAKYDQASLSTHTLRMQAFPDGQSTSIEEHEPSDMCLGRIEPKSSKTTSQAARASLRTLPDSFSRSGEYDDGPQVIDEERYCLDLTSTERRDSLETSDSPLSRAHSLTATFSRRTRSSSPIGGSTVSDASATKRGLCHVCKTDTSHTTDALSICSSCPRRYHRRCHPVRPTPVELIHSESWQCYHCIEKQVRRKGGSEALGGTTRMQVAATEQTSMPKRSLLNPITGSLSHADVTAGQMTADAAKDRREQERNKAEPRKRFRIRLMSSEKRQIAEQEQHEQIADTVAESNTPSAEATPSTTVSSGQPPIACRDDTTVTSDNQLARDEAPSTVQAQQSALRTIAKHWGEDWFTNWMRWIPDGFLGGQGDPDPSPNFLSKCLLQRFAELAKEKERGLAPHSAADGCRAAITARISDRAPSTRAPTTPLLQPNDTESFLKVWKSGNAVELTELFSHAADKPGVQHPSVIRSVKLVPDQRKLSRSVDFALMEAMYGIQLVEAQPATKPNGNSSSASTKSGTHVSLGAEVELHTTEIEKEPQPLVRRKQQIDSAVVGSGDERSYTGHTPARSTPQPPEIPEPQVAQDPQEGSAPKAARCRKISSSEAQDSEHATLKAASRHREHTNHAKPRSRPAKPVVDQCASCKRSIAHNPAIVSADRLCSRCKSDVLEKPALGRASTSLLSEQAERDPTSVVVASIATEAESKSSKVQASPAKISQSNDHDTDRQQVTAALPEYAKTLGDHSDHRAPPVHSSGRKQRLPGLQSDIQIPKDVELEIAQNTDMLPFERPDLAVVHKSTDRTTDLESVSGRKPSSAIKTSYPATAAKRISYRRPAVNAYDLGDSEGRPKGTYEKLIGMALCAAPDHILSSSAIVEWVAENIPNYSLHSTQTAWQGGLKATMIMQSVGYNHSKDLWLTLEDHPPGNKTYRLESGQFEKMTHWNSRLGRPVPPSERSGAIPQQSNDTVAMASTNKKANFANGKNIPRKTSALGPKASLENVDEDIAPGAEAGAGASDDTSDDKPLVQKRHKASNAQGLASTKHAAHRSVPFEDDRETETPAKASSIATLVSEPLLSSHSRELTSSNPGSHLALEAKTANAVQSKNMLSSAAEYSAISLFQEWPEYDPKNHRDRVDDSAKITSHQTWKKRQGQPLTSVHDSWINLQPTPHDGSNRIKRLRPHAVLAWPWETGQESTVECKTVEELFDLPAHPLPILNEGHLAYRDGLLNEDDTLPRAKVVYKTSYA